MRYSEATQGRTFVIRLEDGDVLHETIEQFAAQKNIRAGALIIVGGVDKESTLIVGPRQGRALKIEPMEHTLDEVHEVAGTGTLFPDESGAPKLHMHLACGREETTKTGCVRKGVICWQVLEVILFELTNTEAVRKFEQSTGFSLLHP
ncbi:MAG: PPC domain-containing DNA-binding protein [Chitinivibrionales bacterium]